MVQRIVHIQPDPNFIFNKEEMHLLLSVDYYTTTVALLHPLTRQWVAVEVFQTNKEDTEHCEATLTELHQQSGLLQMGVPTAKLYLRTPNAMLVPESLLGDTKKWLQIQYGLRLTDEIFTDVLSNQMAVIGKINAAWLSHFTQSFKQVYLHATLSLVVNHALEIAKINQPPVMVLVFGNNLLELAIAGYKNLLLAKCFYFNNIDDLTYNLLNICSQLQISPADVMVRVQGLIEDASPLHESLFKYFFDVQLDVANPQLVGKALQQIPAHYFTALTTAP